MHICWCDRKTPKCNKTPNARAKLAMFLDSFFPFPFFPSLPYTIIRLSVSHIFELLDATLLVQEEGEEFEPVLALVIPQFLEAILLVGLISLDVAVPL